MSGKAMWRLAVVVLVASLIGPSMAAQPSSVGDEVTAVTIPSKSVIMSFYRPGRVVKVNVKVGDKVKPGDVLAEQDNSEEMAAYLLAKGQAEDETALIAQEKIRDQKEKEYDRKLHTPTAVNTSELEQAMLDWEVEKAKVELAKFQQLQDKHKLEQADAVLQKTKLVSQIDATVAEVVIQAGESVDTQSMKVLRIVNVDPLWVDVPAPFAKARSVKMDDLAKVKFADGVREGKVIAISPVGNSSSGSRMVRVSIPNPEGIAPGETVRVTFTSDGNVAAANDKP